MQTFSLDLPDGSEYEYELKYSHVTPGQKGIYDRLPENCQPATNDEAEAELPDDLVLIACWVTGCSMTLEAMKELEDKELERVCSWLLEQPDEEYDPPEIEKEWD